MQIYLSELCDKFFAQSGLPEEFREAYRQAFVAGFIEGTLVDPAEWVQNVKNAPADVQARYAIITPYKNLL